MPVTHDNRPFLLGDRIVYLPWAAHGHITSPASVSPASVSLGDEVTLSLDSRVTLIAPVGDVIHESDNW